MRSHIALLATLALAAGCTCSNGNKPVSSDFVFNGYTNHWQNVYQKQYRYSNLYRVNVTDIEKSIAQSKRDLAQSMGIPGLQVQEGFFNALASADYKVLVNPTSAELKSALAGGKVLVYAEKDSETAASLLKKCKIQSPDIKSYQINAEDFSPLYAFQAKKNLLAAVGSQADIDAFKAIVEGALQTVNSYELKRGWFGAASTIMTVGVTPGTPIDIMGRGMNEGNSWFVFSGGYEAHSGTRIADWVSEVGSCVVTDLGASRIFGCDDWDDFQDQLMGSRESWINYREKKHGYIFRNFGAAKSERDFGKEDDYNDGYFAQVGHEKQINNADKPFVIMTGGLLGGTSNSMVLFNPKGKEFNRAGMWDAIMSRRSVAVGENATVMGDAIYRNTIQLLILDKDYINEYFGENVNMESFIEGTRLHLVLTNYYNHKVSGKLSISCPTDVTVNGAVPSVSLKAGETKEYVIDLNPSPAVMGRLSAVVAHLDWGSSSKSVMACLDMPPAVGTHQLLYGDAAGTQFPVSIYNFTNEESIPVKVSVADLEGNEVYSTGETISAAKGTAKILSYDLNLPCGGYTVCTEAMGVVAKTQLGIGSEQGSVTVRAEDLDGDGVDEYIMENNKVRVTLLTTGARIIEYIVKSKNDNVFFKLWPEKPHDINRPFREWAFWPFGGFEDFLGQASMETHKVYTAEIIKSEGNYGEVKMRAEYYGNVIEKTFSLYGDTPLLGIRFALDMVNPELNVLGPQPIVSVGDEHGPEDRYIIPEVGGQQEYVMDPKNMWGKILHLQEGWNAAYDTKANTAFVGAYPVNRPYYLHMWFNLATNPDSNYPYVELQPWLPLFHNSTSYFSYYMWADGGSWKNGVQELRDRNLITERQ